MAPILDAVSSVAFFISIISLLIGYTLLLELSGLPNHIWPIVPCSLDSVVQAHTVMLATCAIMNFPKPMISLLIVDAPSQDTTREPIIQLVRNNNIAG
ncbi:hypothetical protein SLE2022_318390 [Rubroshorea leprosula]